MLSGIFVAAGTVVVFAVEKLPGVENYAMRVRIVDGIVFALPFLLAALWLKLRSRAKGAAPAPRPGYPFGRPR